MICTTTKNIKATPSGWFLTSSNVSKGDISILGGSLNTDLVVNGNVDIVNGFVNLEGNTLSIKGNLVHSDGNLQINKGRLIVDGDYRIQKLDSETKGYVSSNGYLDMRQPEDYILVKGDFVMQSSKNHCYGSRLANGVLEVQGNFLQKTGYFANFCATGNHKVVLSGTRGQIVDFDSQSSKFQTLELLNTSSTGVGFVSNLAANQVINGGKTLFTKNIKATPSGWFLTSSNVSKGDISILGGSLNTDLVVNGNVDIVNGFVNLEGNTLSIKGNLVHSDGNLQINKGRLIVDGDYRIQKLDSETKGYVSSNGYLDMRQPEDYILVKGDFVMQSSKNHCYGFRLANGVLEVQGNFLQKTGYFANFCATGNHKVVLSGSSPQNVKFDSPYSSTLATLILDNKTKVVFDSNIKVKTLFNHRRTIFELPEHKETDFPDYDGDGVRDVSDPYPLSPDDKPTPEEEFNIIEPTTDENPEQPTDPVQQPTENTDDDNPVEPIDEYGDTNTSDTTVEQPIENVDDDNPVEPIDEYGNTNTSETTVEQPIENVDDDNPVEDDNPVSTERVINIPQALLDTEICSQQECTLDIDIDQAGFYVVSARLLDGNTEGFWGISFTTTGGINAGGFNSGATLKENGDAPGFMAFYLSEPETVNITPYEYTGNVNNLVVQISRQDETGERTLIFDQQTASGTTHTTEVLQPGFYVAAAFSKAGDPRGQFGFSVNANSMMGGVNIGGWIDENGAGFGGLYVDSPQTVQIQALFGNTYGESGSGYMQIDVYQQQSNGERVLYYSLDSSLF